MDKVAVIIPVYNVEDYVERCIESVLSQRYSNFELILVDDGSTDKSGSICDAFKTKDKRVHVVHQMNQGLSAARNAGIDWCFSRKEVKWITFIDSDDWVDESYLAAMIQSGLKNNSEIVIGNYRIVTDRFNKSNVAFNEIENYIRNIEDAFINDPARITMACAKLYKKELFFEKRFPNGKYHEDCFLIHRIVFPSKKITFIDQPLYLYYSNPNSITHQISSKRMEDSLEAMEMRNIYFLQNHFIKSYMFILFSSGYNATIINLSNKNCPKITSNDKQLALWRLRISILVEKPKFTEKEWLYGLAFPRITKLLAFFKHLNGEKS